MFYDGELQTDHDATADFIQIKKFWPQGRDCPLAFCNIEGREGEAVSGNKKSSLLSKSNADEARKVVRAKICIIHRAIALFKCVYVISNYVFICTSRE